jgi:hypothetical protein
MSFSVTKTHKWHWKRTQPWNAHTNCTHKTQVLSTPKRFFAFFFLFCPILCHFYQVRQSRTWSRSYKFPSPSSPTRFKKFTHFFDNFLITFWQLFNNFLTTFCTTFWQLTIFWQLFDIFFLLFDTIWHYSTFVRPQVFQFIGPSNDGRRHGRGTYLFLLKGWWGATKFLPSFTYDPALNEGFKGTNYRRPDLTWSHLISLSKISLDLTWPDLISFSITFDQFYLLHWGVHTWI